MEEQNLLLRHMRWFDEKMDTYQTRRVHRPIPLRIHHNENKKVKLIGQPQSPQDSEKSMSSFSSLSHEDIGVHGDSSGEGSLGTSPVGDRAQFFNKRDKKRSDFFWPVLKNQGQLPQILKPQRKTFRQARLTLRKILLERMLNVENLSIGDHQDLHLDMTDQLYLPALKTFSWHATSHALNENGENDSSEEEDGPVPMSKFATLSLNDEQGREKKRQMAYQILRAAPNLKLIKDFHFESDFDVVIAAGKCKAVEELTLYDTVNVDHLFEFIRERPPVRILQLISHPTNDPDLDLHDEEKERLAKAIKRVFQLTHETLAVLNLSQFASSIDLEIPVPLNNLTQLSIGRGHGQNPSKCLPSNIYNLCPNLKILDCSGLQCDLNYNWEVYFPPKDSFGGNFDDVKCLVMPDTCSQFWIEKFQKLCPNFKKAVVVTSYGGGGVNLNFTLRKIFRTWRHLQFLELRFENFTAPSEHLNFSLDSAFTGLKEEVCKGLRMAAAGVVPFDKFSQPVRCSVTNLKELQQVDIIFEHAAMRRLKQRLPQVFDEVHPEESDHPPLMSSLSCRYGFSHLFDLKVALIFDRNCPWGREIRKKCESLTCKYINLRHRQDGACNSNNPGHHHHHTELEAEMGVRLYGYP